MAEPAQKIECAITGTTGYVGSRVATYLRWNGFVVRELRHTIKSSGESDGLVIPYSLDREIEATALAGTDILIHCAYDFRYAKWERIFDVNVKGSLKLFTAAKRAGVKKIVFVSTMSAFDACKSLYGKAKLEVEKEALKMGGIVIRPGLVFGSDSNGMIAALSKVVCFSRFVPLIGRGDQLLYLVHEEDLCQLFHNICLGGSDSISKPIIAASQKGTTLKQILQAIAETKSMRPVFIPLPWRLVWLGLKCSEIVRLRLGFRSDSLISLLNQEQSPDFEMTRKIGVKFRDFDQLG